MDVVLVEYKLEICQMLFNVTGGHFEENDITSCGLFVLRIEQSKTLFIIDKCQAPC